MIKKSNYVRHSTLSIKSTIDAIRNTIQLNLSKPPRVLMNNTPVNLQSMRLQTFAKKGQVCAGCGLTAEFFAIERNHHDEAKSIPYHINLYGIDSLGEEVLFTHDHIIAKANGGADNLTNTQTMCQPCNGIKGRS